MQMKRRLVGLVGFTLVLVLVGLVFQYAPQRDAPPVPSDRVELMARTHIPKVECFRKSVERAVPFTHGLLDVNFRALSVVSYWYCHNWYGRDWVRPYHMRNTILYQRKQCDFPDGGKQIRGFKFRAYFRDGYRASKNYSKGFWQDCHNKGFSSRSVYLSRRSTPRLFNVKNIPPWAIAKTTVVVPVIWDASGKKRLPMKWHTSKPGVQI